MHKKIKICLILLFFVRLTASPVNAQIMSNREYILSVDDSNPASNIATQGSEINSEIRISKPFSIRLSTDIIDFGSLVPTNSIIRTADLEIENPNEYGYSVLVSENEPLSATSQTNKTFISDTTCDNGLCSAQAASEWTNTLTYGFGYRCDNLRGTGCDSSFTDLNSYKHFPNIANNEDPVSIMTGIGSISSKVRIHYKVNISANQTKGLYNNKITYLGIPNF